MKKIIFNLIVCLIPIAGFLSAEVPEVLCGLSIDGKILKLCKKTIAYKQPTLKEFQALRKKGDIKIIDPHSFSSASGNILFYLTDCEGEEFFSQSVIYAHTGNAPASARFMGAAHAQGNKVYLLLARAFSTTMTIALFEVNLSLEANKETRLSDYEDSDFATKKENLLAPISEHKIDLGIEDSFGLDTVTLVRDNVGFLIFIREEGSRKTSIKLQYNIQENVWRKFKVTSLDT